MLPVFKSIRSLCAKELSQFLYANAMYSVSTGLISILAPYIINDAICYENFIYIFQSIMYLTSVFTAGFTVALLRFYKYAPAKYESFFSFITLLIIGAILILGLWKNNGLTEWLNIHAESSIEHLIIYIGVCSSLIYIFNRAYLTAKEKFQSITYGITIIFLLRILAMAFIAIAKITNVKIIIFMVCILPMCHEILIFGKRVLSMKISSPNGLSEFVVFALKTAIIGILFLTSNRLLAISVKSYDNSIAASLSYAYGLIGLVSILNATISSYFIGKLDCNDPEMIAHYLKKIRAFIPYFAITLLGVSFVAYLFVKTTYPCNPTETAWICVVTICQSGIIFYLGLVTLLAKTYNCLNVQLLINIAVCCVVYLIVNSLGHSTGIIPFYILVNSVISMGEVLLLMFVLNKHRLFSKEHIKQ